MAVEAGDGNQASMCRCIAGRPSPECMHGGGSVAESRLASCTDVAATEAGAGCWYKSQAAEAWVAEGGNGERLGQLVSMMKTCGVKSSVEKSAGVLKQLFWTLVSSSVKAVGVLAEHITGNHDHSHCISDTGSLHPSSLFLAISIYLSFASFLGGVKPKWVFSFIVPKGWGCWSVTLLFLSQQGELFLAQALLVLSSLSLEYGMTQAK